MGLDNILLIPGVGGGATPPAFAPTDIASLLWWYDPSDLSTLFQDSAGTTPVTSDGDPVGLVLDKSQGVTAGPELIPDVSFDDPTDWSVVGSASVSGGQGLFTAASSGNRIDSNATLQLGKWYEVEVDVASITSGSVRVATAIGTSPFFTLSAGLNKCYLPATGSLGTATLVAIGTTTAAINSFSVKELPGYHRFQPTSGSRLTYRTSGGLHWLEYGGVDDGMYTATTVDHSVSDEVTICSGSEKSSDVAAGIAIELTTNSSSVSGSYSLRLPNVGGSGQIFSTMRGTSQTDAEYLDVALTGAAAVYSQVAKISTPSHVLRVNGSVVDTQTGTLGTGTFSNSVLYFGRRNNANAPFNGKEFQSCGFTTALNGTDLSNIESYVAGKAGVTI